MTPLPPKLPRLTNEQKKPESSEPPQKGLGLGFGQPQATMREFVILLGLLLGGYVVSHVFIPSNSSLSLFKVQSNKIRSPILQDISLLKDELKNKESILLSQLSQAKTTKDSKSASQTSYTTSQILKPSSENSLLKPETFEKWKSSLKSANLSSKEERYLGDLSSLISQFKQLESKDIKEVKEDELIIIFLDINKNLTGLESYLEKSLEQNLFWTGNGRWLEVILWSLFGTILYIIQQTSEYYLSSNSLSSSDKRVLIRRKPQYYYFLFQSPFTALVILWILSMANLNIAGIALALSSAPPEVLISLAFILGLYNRVANTQLNLIVAAIFGEAWKKTVRKIEIQKFEHEDNILKSGAESPRIEKNQPKTQSRNGNFEVYFGQSTDFDVLPDVKVRWSIVSKPSIGIIDESTGTYIAPPYGCYYKDGQLYEIPKKISNTHSQTSDVNLDPSQSSNGDLDNNVAEDNYTQDIIRAVREDEENISALALVIIKPAPKD